MSGQRRRANPNPYKPGREPGGYARWLERQPEWQAAMRQKAREAAARLLWDRVHPPGMTKPRVRTGATSEHDQSPDRRTERTS